MSTDKPESDEDDGGIIDLGDDSLSDVHGGGKFRRIGSGKAIGNDTLVGVNNDTLFAGSGDDGLIRR